MILAVHQPNFLPWVGYFWKMAASDHFVLLDEVQFPRGNTFANRATVAGPNGYIELTVPVSVPKGHSGKVSYRGLELPDGKWRRKLLKTLEMGYKKAPYFQEHFPFIEEWLRMEDFCEMNIAFIRYVRDRTAMGTDLSLLSEYEGIFGERSERIVELCRKNEASIYLSGKGAAKYNEPEHFEREGIELQYLERPHFDNELLQEAMRQGRSILDPLFHLGAEAIGEAFRRSVRGHAPKGS